MIYKILDSGSFAHIAQNPDNPVNPAQKQGVFCPLPNMNYFGSIISQKVLKVHKVSEIAMTSWTLWTLCEPKTLNICLPEQQQPTTDN